MRTIYRVIVSAVIFSKDNKILLCKKDPKRGGVYGDCWQIPGGGMEENENQMETLAREIKEEVDIDISSAGIDKTPFVCDGKSEKTLRNTGERVLIEMTFNDYKVVLNEISSKVKVKLNEEFVEYKWFGVEELKNIKHTPPSILLFKSYGYLNT
jgi:8-oxo-dGTP pyrophosphatase MutT (NUDIX family)